MKVKCFLLFLIALLLTSCNNNEPDEIVDLSQVEQNQSEMPKEASFEEPLNSETNIQTPESNSDNMNEYTSFLSSFLSNLSSAMVGISEQASMLSDNYNLISDDNWIVDTAVYLAAFQSLEMEINAYDISTVPDNLIPIHNIVKDCAKLYRESGDYFTTFVDESDTDALSKSVEKTQEGYIKLAQANELLETELGIQ